MFDKKIHYKMYKAGKQWVFAAIFALAATLTTYGVKADNVSASPSAANANTEIVNSEKAANANSSAVSVKQNQNNNDKSTQAGDQTQTKQAASQTDGSNTNAQAKQDKTADKNQQNQTTTTNNKQTDTQTANTDTAKQQNQADNSLTQGKATSKNTTAAADNQNGQNTAAQTQPTKSNAANGQTKKNTNKKKTASSKYSPVKISAPKSVSNTATIVIPSSQAKKAAKTVNTAGGSFITNGGKTYYQLSDSSYAKGKQKINNAFYYFTPKNGVMLQNTFFRIGSSKTKYYAGKDGKLAMNSRKINKHWYLFDYKTGAMQVGFHMIPNKKYLAYYKSNGQRFSGYKYVNHKRYHFSSKTGAMVAKPGRMKIGRYWYKFNRGHKLQVGFMTISKRQAYYKRVHRKRVRRYRRVKVRYYYSIKGRQEFGSHKIWGKWYLFTKKTGQQLLGVRKVGKYRYLYAGKDGSRQFGLKKYSGSTYLLDKKKGIMQTGFQFLRTGTQTGRLAYFTKSAGKMLLGQHKIGRTRYTFDKYNGNLTAIGKKKVAASDSSNAYLNKVKVHGKWYVFDDQGQVQTYFQNITDNQIVYGSKVLGYLLTGIRHIKLQADNKWHYYYFDKKTGLMFTGFKNLSAGRRVYFSQNSATIGQMQFGQQHINGRWYTFENNTGTMLDTNFNASAVDIDQNNIKELGVINNRGEKVWIAPQYIARLNKGTVINGQTFNDYTYITSHDKGSNTWYVLRDSNFKVLGTMVVVNGGHGAQFGVEYHNNVPYLWITRYSSKPSKVDSLGNPVGTTYFASRIQFTPDLQGDKTQSQIASDIKNGTAPDTAVRYGGSDFHSDDDWFDMLQSSSYIRTGFYADPNNSNNNKIVITYKSGDVQIYNEKDVLATIGRGNQNAGTNVQANPVVSFNLNNYGFNTNTDIFQSSYLDGNIFYFTSGNMKNGASGRIYALDISNPSNIQKVFMHYLPLRDMTMDYDYFEPEGVSTIVDGQQKYILLNGNNYKNDPNEENPAAAMYSYVWALPISGTEVEI